MSLAITPSTLPDATSGEGYFLGLSTTGATGTVQWQLSDGVLPPGMNLSSDGRLCGQVAFSGTWPSFTVLATDGSSPPQVASQSFTLTATAPGD